MTIQTTLTTALGRQVPAGYTHLIDQAVTVLTDRENRIANEIVRLGREAGLSEADVRDVLTRAVQAAENPVTAPAAARAQAPGVAHGQLRQVASRLQDSINTAFREAGRSLGL